MRKTYVLDTNVVLYDPRAIYSFANDNVVIPFDVLEEIDNFKKGTDSVNVNARVFARILDELSEYAVNTEGIYSVDLGHGRGQLFIYSLANIHANLTKVDNRILSLVYELTTGADSDEEIILVTKDINLRVKARSLNLIAQDYDKFKVENPEELYKGYRVIENYGNIDALYNSDGIDAMGIDAPIPNEYFILKNGNQSALARYSEDSKRLEKITVTQASNIKPKNAEQVFALDALTNPDIQIVALTGKAGSGKTLLSMAAAISKKSLYKQIFISRPVMPLGKDIGYLPGGINEKLDPYMQPLFDNIKQIKDVSSKPDDIEKLITTEKIVVEAMTYIRGRSLPKIFFIADEMQNASPHEMKTLISRMGEGSKVVICGDLYQIDNPFLDSRSNGLAYAISKLKGEKLFAHVNLEKVERSAVAELAARLL